MVRGFTLIEVMIVTAIIAILAAVAIPNYRDYILRGQLVDGTTILSTLRADMERYYQDNRTYVATGAFTPPCASANAATRTQGNFVVTCVTANLPSPTFTLTATGNGPVVGFAYTTNERDARTTASVGAGWPTPTPNTCWVVKKGQACN